MFVSVVVFFFVFWGGLVCPGLPQKKYKLQKKRLTKTIKRFFFLFLMEKME